MISLILLLLGVASFAFGIYRAATHAADEDAGHAGPWMLSGIALAGLAGLWRVYATGALSGS